MCRSRAGITSPQNGDGRLVVVADLTRDASIGKRNFGLDTRSMEDFAHFLMETGWLDTLEADLASMNSDKLGRPFVFTDKAIQWANRLRIAFKAGYRLARGVMNHFLRKHGLPGISLTQFYDRCRKASAVGGADGRVLASGPCDVDVSEAPISVAVDSTGMSLNKYGGWRCHHWNLKSVTGWIKLHAAADPDTNRILAYAVTDEKGADVKQMERLIADVMSAGHKVGRILADAAYDKKSFWSDYSAQGIDVAINVNSSQLNKFSPTGRYEIRNHGCMPRANAMRRIMAVGKDQWKQEIGYGRRWKVECTFSDVKRLFGDILRSRTRRTDVEETVAKVVLLNEYKGIRMRCQESR